MTRGAGCALILPDKIGEDKSTVIMIERILSVLKKEFLQVFRDPRMKIIIFIAPIMQVIIFSYAANMDVNNIRTAVYDLDNTKQSRDVIREFVYSKYFNQEYIVNDDEQQRDLIDRSLVDAVIRINRGFAEDIQANRTADVQLIVDGTDSNMASIALGYAGRVMDKYSSSMMNKKIEVLPIGVNKIPKVDLRARAWFNENLISRYYFIPGVIALIATLMSLLLTAMAIVREKEIGTIEQLIVSPLKPFELILGKMLPFAIIALVDVVLITLVGVFWFKMPIRGSLLLLFVSTALYLLTTLGVGLFISTVSSTQQEALMSTFLFLFPAFLLCGFIFPIANMPKIVQYITYINPLRYYLVILRGIFLKGVGAKILWPQMSALLVLGLVIFTLSTIRFHKRLG